MLLVVFALFAGWALFCVLPARCCPTPPYTKTEIWWALTLVGWLYFVVGGGAFGVYIYAAYGLK